VIDIVTMPYLRPATVADGFRQRRLLRRPPAPPWVPRSVFAFHHFSRRYFGPRTCGRSENAVLSVRPCGTPTHKRILKATLIRRRAAGAAPPSRDGP
jgi:hypothetical protein